MVTAVERVLAKFEAKSKKMLSRCDDAHGIEHAERVANLGEEIRKHDGGDQLVVRVACLSHDWYTFVGREYHVGDEAMLHLKDELMKLGFLADNRKKIIEAVKYHEDYGFELRNETKLPIEARILQDADRLDAIGMIGLMRTCYVGGVLKQPFGTPAEMEDVPEAYHVGREEPVLRHFYTKILKLGNMNTHYARELAKKRLKVVNEALERLKLEWKGEA